MPRPRRTPGPPAPAASSSQSQHTKPGPPATSSTEFEICIYDVPRYRPGSTPPQPPISLLPVHDSDAFIVGKLVTPFGIPDDTGDHSEDDDDDDSDLEFEERRRRALQRLVAATTATSPAGGAPAHEKQQLQLQNIRRVLNYVVGWPDVPYARQLVPCTQVLDYVSPRTLEEWEYSATLRQHAAAEAAAAAAAAQKRGPKTSKVAKVPQAVKEEGDGDGNTPTETAARSSHPLNGPQRRRRRRKLLGPAKKRKAPAAPAAKQAPPTPAAAGAAPAEAAPVSATTTPRPTKYFAAGAASPAGARPASASTAMGPGDAAASPASDRQQLLVHGIPSLSSGKQRTGLSLTQPYRPPTSASADDRPALVMRVTAGGTAYLHPADGSMDIDELAGDGWEHSRPAGLTVADGAGDGMDYGETAPLSTADGTDEDEEENNEDDDEAEDAENQQQDQSARPVTYIPPPALPYHFSPNKHRAGNVASLSTVPRPESARSEGSSTPTLKRKRETPDAAADQTAAGDEMDVDDEDAAEEEEEEDDELYEVEGIEDDYISTEDGSGHQSGSKRAGKGQTATVRFFLVRWKGDWPPDQNPTWEPAENLPPDMVRQYLKKAARHKAQGGGSRNANGNSGS